MGVNTIFTHEVQVKLGVINLPPYAVLSGSNLRGVLFFHTAVLASNTS